MIVWGCLWNCRLFTLTLTYWQFQLVLNKSRMLMLWCKRYFWWQLRLFKLFESTFFNYFIYFSFFKKTSQLFYSIMMAMWMDGGILTGVARPYILLLGIKQSGKHGTSRSDVFFFLPCLKYVHWREFALIILRKL